MRIICDNFRKNNYCLTYSTYVSFRHGSHGDSRTSAVIPALSGRTNVILADGHIETMDFIKLDPKGFRTYATTNAPFRYPNGDDSDSSQCIIYLPYKSVPKM